MEIHDPLGDGQTQPGPAVGGRPGRVGTVEALEDLARLPGRDAGSLVGDLDPDRPVLGQGAHPNLRSLGSMAHRVLHQVGHHLVDPLGIAVDDGPPPVDPARIALVGLRAVDPGERELLRRLDVRVHTMSHVDRGGVEPAIRDALAHVAGPGFVHVSVDIDVVDPEAAPGVGTPVRGGLSYREAHLALELVAEAGVATSLDVVEVNPILDRVNGTAELAVDLIASALGATIL